MTKIWRAGRGNVSWPFMTANGGGSSQAPALTNDNGVVTAMGGYPAPPRLTNDNGIITAQAA